jgi:hypothetical protein
LAYQYQTYLFHADINSTAVVFSYILDLIQRASFKVIAELYSHRAMVRLVFKLLGMPALFPILSIEFKFFIDFIDYRIHAIKVQINGC